MPETTIAVPDRCVICGCRQFEFVWVPSRAVGPDDAVDRLSSDGLVFDDHLVAGDAIAPIIGYRCDNCGDHEWASDADGDPDPLVKVGVVVDAPDDSDVCLAANDEHNYSKATFAAQVISATEQGDKGRVEAIVSAFDVDYRMGFRTKHRITRDAFRASIGKDANLPIFLFHNWSWSEQAPVGAGKAEIVTLPKSGIKVAADFFLDTDAGRGAFRAIKAGALREWSIGYRITRFHVEEDDDGNDVIVVEEAELLEASAVLRGANPDTQTLKVAALASAGTPRVDVDKIARRHGMPDPDELSPALRAALDRARAAEPADDNAVCRSLASVADILRRGVESGAGGIAQLSQELTEPVLLAAIQPTTGHSEFLGRPDYPPVPLSIVDLIPRIPHSEGEVKEPSVARVDGDTPIVQGGTAFDLQFATSGSPQKLARFPVSLTTTVDVTTDAGIGLEAVLRTLRDGTRALLGAALIAADGSVDDFSGVVGGSIGTVLNANGLSAVQALSRAAQLIHDDGFSGPLSLIGGPTLVDRGLLGKTVREEIPSIVAYLPSPYFAPGECVIADWMAAATLYVAPASVSSSVSHERNFVRGRVTYLSELRAAVAWHNTGQTSIVHVINLGAS